MLSNTTAKLQNQQLSFNFSDPADQQRQKQQQQQQEKRADAIKKVLDSISKKLTPLKEIAKPTDDKSRMFRTGEAVGGIRKRVQGVKDVFKTDRADKDKNLFQVGGGALKRQVETFTSIVFGDLIAQFQVLKDVVKGIRDYARYTINTIKDIGKFVTNVVRIGKNLKAFNRLRRMRRMKSKKSQNALTGDQLSLAYGEDGAESGAVVVKKKKTSNIKGEEQQREGSLWRKAVIFYLRSINKKLKKLLKMGGIGGKDGGGGFFSNLFKGLMNNILPIVSVLGGGYLASKLMRAKLRMAGLGIAGKPLRSNALRKTKAGRFARRFRPGRRSRNASRLNKMNPFAKTSRDRLNRMKNARKKPGLISRLTKGAKSGISSVGTKIGSKIPSAATIASKIPSAARVGAALAPAGAALGGVGRGLGTAARVGGRVLAPAAGLASVGMGAYRGVESIKGLITGEMDAGQALANFVAGVGLVSPGDLDARAAKSASQEGVLAVRDLTNAVTSGDVFKQPLYTTLTGGAKNVTKEQTMKAVPKRKLKFYNAWKDDLPDWYKPSMVPDAWVDGTRKTPITWDDVKKHIKILSAIHAGKIKPGTREVPKRKWYEKFFKPMLPKQQTEKISSKLQETPTRTVVTQALQGKTTDLEQQIRKQNVADLLASSGGTNIINSNNTVVSGGVGPGGEGFGTLSDPVRNYDTSYSTLLQKSMVNPMST